MVEFWFIELGKAIGRLFVNPLLYWSVLLIFVIGYKRIKQERVHFGFKVFDVFSEWRNTWILSICTGIFLSLLALGIGLVFSYESILLLSIVVIVLSLTLRITMLSASYSIGITFLLLLFLPFLLKYQTYVDVDLFTQVNFTALIVLLGIFLLVEAVLLKRIEPNETFPELALSNRGVWVGQLHLKKLSIIPFFTLIPSGLITPYAPFWPYFSFGGESYSILLVPFVIGFDHIVRGSLPRNAATGLSKSISLLAILVILLAIGSMYLPWLSLVAVLIAILGREYISYKHRIIDKEKTAYFNPLDPGLKILGVIPGTPAAQLKVVVGETIVKVNNQKVNSVDDFYHALQEKAAFFKLDIADTSGEVRFVQRALYEGDPHELGFIFAQHPHRYK